MMKGRDRASRSRNFRLIALVPFALVATGFRSVPTQNIHKQITEEACQGLGLESKVVDQLVSSNSWQDWGEIKLGLHGLKPNAKYRPEHHCDRNAGESHAIAFSRAVAFLQGEKTVAMKAKLDGDSIEAAKHAGMALHALQDFFSHSNYVDLDSGLRERLRASLLTGDETAPAELKITGYDRETGDDPVDDPYGHSKNCKDSPEENAESQRKDASGLTSFQRARAAAVTETRAFLADVFKS